MSLAIVHSRANIGIEAPLVSVETHLSNGLPGFSIVGMPEKAVNESRERVRSAILNALLEFPAKRITVNLAPADLPKTGGRFDLAIAVGILAASGQLPEAWLHEYELLGELALSGEVRHVPGVLPGLLAGCERQRKLIIPAANREEAALIGSSDIFLCGHLLDLCRHSRGEQALPVVTGASGQPSEEDVKAVESLDDVVGQEQAKRALILAAAGGHNLLMSGPPGTGKTMLASRMPSVLPELDNKRALEIAAIRSMAGAAFSAKACFRAPFRAPHHTASAVALVGGGRTVTAGEISLAHHGVLFLDELPEFSPSVLEVLREPLESGSILISRAAYQTRLPASFQLIAAMNPCPCGYHGDTERECRCTPDRIKQYQRRVSGPLLDRIDLHIGLRRLSRAERRELLAQKCPADSGLRTRVKRCREHQLQRAGKINARLNQQEILLHCSLTKADRELLDQAVEQFKLSARAYFRVLKVARTVADLAGRERIGSGDLLEAIAYRQHEHQ